MHPDTESGCVEWSGNKWYGRPSWTLWMQREVWEEAYGELPPKSRVSETCSTVGCLEPEHLQVRVREEREVAVECRRCASELSRDRNGKTYCKACNRARTRNWRTRSENEV